MTTNLVTVTEIAHNYRVPVARIYVIAHRKKWQRVKWQGRVYYHLDEVDAVLGKDATVHTS